MLAKRVIPCLDCGYREGKYRQIERGGRARRQVARVRQAHERTWFRHRWRHTGANGRDDQSRGAALGAGGEGLGREGRLTRGAVPKSDALLVLLATRSGPDGEHDASTRELA